MSAEYDNSTSNNTLEDLTTAAFSSSGESGHIHCSYFGGDVHKCVSYLINCSLACPVLVISALWVFFCARAKLVCVRKHVECSDVGL